MPHFYFSSRTTYFARLANHILLKAPCYALSSNLSRTYHLANTRSTPVRSWSSWTWRVWTSQWSGSQTHDQSFRRPTTLVEPWHQTGIPPAISSHFLWIPTCIGTHVASRASQTGKLCYWCLWTNYCRHLCKLEMWFQGSPLGARPTAGEKSGGSV